MTDWETRTKEQLAFKKRICTSYYHYTYMSQEEQNPEWQEYYDVLSACLEEIIEDLEAAKWPVLSDDHFHTSLARRVLDYQYDDREVNLGDTPIDKYLWSVLVLSQYEFYEGDNKISE